MSDADSIEHARPTFEVAVLGGNGSKEFSADDYRQWRMHAARRFGDLRWHYISAEDEEVVISASLLIFDWSADNDGVAAVAANLIRRAGKEKPTIVALGSVPGKEEDREEFVKERVATRVITNDLSARSFDKALRELGNPIPECPRIVREPDDMICKRIVAELENADETASNPSEDSIIRESRSVLRGLQRLDRILAKYFPRANDASIGLVGGGWSGATILHLNVEGDDREFFLKFFETESKFENEVNAHGGARKWLGKHTVNIVGLRDTTEPAFDDLKQAFPYVNVGSRYPVCYHSGLRGGDRKTLRSVYQNGPAGIDDFLDQAYLQLLRVLNEGQDDQWIANRAPRNDPTKQNVFRDPARVAGIIECVNDIEKYCEIRPIKYGKNGREKRNAAEIVRSFVRDSNDLPDWLAKTTPVRIGHVHTDPTSRNCLVNEKDPLDLVLIDCGGYRPDGFRILDLAQIEADIKLILMAIEDAGRMGYGDLNPTRLKDWHGIESESIRAGLEFHGELAVDLLKRLSRQNSIRRAYRLISSVRKHAHAIAYDIDPHGKHYFAALLHWNLRWLKLPAIRRSKKLLALYSAAEILLKY